MFRRFNLSIEVPAELAGEAEDTWDYFDLNRLLPDVEKHCTQISYKIRPPVITYCCSGEVSDEMMVWLKLRFAVGPYVDLYEKSMKERGKYR